MAPLALRIKAEVRTALEAAAKEDGISLTDWTEQALRERLIARGFLPKPPRPRKPTRS